MNETRLCQALSEIRILILALFWQEGIYTLIAIYWAYLVSWLGQLLGYCIVSVYGPWIYSLFGYNYY